MNYYHQKNYYKWYKEQRAAFKKSESFLQSEAFKIKGQKALIWLGNDGRVEMKVAAVPERFYNVVMSWSDWKRVNCSDEEECIYNTWVEEQKANFKKTPEYRNSKFAEFILSSAYEGDELPHFDGVEVCENGNIELCTGETFESAVISLDKFKELKKQQDQAEIEQYYIAV